jgi:hypothetical protein
MKNFTSQEFIPVKVNGLFGGMCYLDLQRAKISQMRNEHEGGSSRAKRNDPRPRHLILQGSI